MFNYAADRSAFLAIFVMLFAIVVSLSSLKHAIKEVSLALEKQYALEQKVIEILETCCEDNRNAAEVISKESIGND